MRPPSKLTACLSALAADPKNTVVLYSERSRTRLEAWFGRSDDPEPTRIGLAAENGQFLRLPATLSTGTAAWSTLSGAAGASASAPGESAPSGAGGAPSAAAVLSPIPSDQKRLAKTRAVTGAAGDAALPAAPAAQVGAPQVELLHSGWKSVVRSTMQFYTERTAGSLLLERETTLVWNFEGADYEFAQSQVRAAAAGIRI